MGEGDVEDQATGDGRTAGAQRASSGTPDVFISYASQDATFANAVVGALEGQGLKCWIAPRDVVPGSLYADGIVRAINEARVVVLILSEHAVASPHVGKEIERASSKRRQIIALHTDSAPLTRAFEYFLSESQWIDVPALGMQAALAKLVDAVGHVPTPSVEVIPAPNHRVAHKRVAIQVAIAAAVAIGLGGAVALGMYYGSSS